MDAGDGQHYFLHSLSMSNNILNIFQSSNTGKNGRWMYRVDDLTIHQSNCLSYGELKVQLVEFLMLNHIDSNRLLLYCLLLS